MAYARRTVTKRPAMAKKPTRTYKKRPSRAKVPYTVKRYVKAQIGKATEDKFQEGLPFDPTAIITLNASSVNPIYFSPLINDVFGLITQGVGQGERTGNEILLKKWVVRGAFTLNPFVELNPTQLLGSSNTYVDVFIGYRNDYQPIADSLPDLYQSGNASTSPVGDFTELMEWINKDVYTVLFRKRFKMGNNSNNNDFSLAKTFSFDICSKALKNVRLKYNDTLNVVQNAKVNAMSVWAIAINGNGTNMFQSSVAFQRQSNFAISITNNVMYTDA